MKTNKTKLLTKVFAFTMALGLVFATGCSNEKSEAELHKEFMASIGGCSETYVGTVSETSYETAQEAATAYVEEEIVGYADVTIVGATSQGTLGETEITALKLPADIQEGMESVEKLEVEYAENEIASLDTLNTNKTVTVYVIKYANDFKYYSPMPVTGETITKSYYDSVFDFTKYQNCTYSWETTVSYDMNVSMPGYGSEKVKMSMKMKQFIQYAEDKIYLEQSIVADTSGMPDLDLSDMNQTICAYMETVDDKVVCYVKTDANGTEWNPTNLTQIGFSSLNELTPFYDQYLDYTYFSKTDYGFAISEENMEKYLEQTFEMADLADYAGMMDINLFVKYYVSNGTLSGMREDGTINVNISESGMSLKMKGVVEAVGTVTNYGTTVVTKPFTE